MSTPVNKKFADQIAPRAYFSKSKSEQELTIFKILIEIGYINLRDSKFLNSQKLGLTQSRFESLVYGYRTILNTRETNLVALEEHLRVVHYDGSKNCLILHLDDKFLREFLIDEFKAAAIYSDGSFNRELIFVKDQDLTRVVSLLSSRNLGAAAESLESQILSTSWSSLGEAVGKSLAGERFIQITDVFKQIEKLINASKSKQ